MPPAKTPAQHSSATGKNRKKKKQHAPEEKIAHSPRRRRKKWHRGMIRCRGGAGRGALLHGPQRELQLAPGAGTGA
eukprot:12911476-Prorocentrum_lima.AAC.1